ncbi:MAG: hypothetical protein QXX41_00425 [Nitrososphaerota archaeon]
MGTKVNDYFSYFRCHFLPVEEKAGFVSVVKNWGVLALLIM